MPEPAAFAQADIPQADITQAEMDAAWAVLTRPRPKKPGLIEVFAWVYVGIAVQGVNSALPSTRAFWRARHPDLVALFDDQPGHPAAGGQR